MTFVTTTAPNYSGYWYDFYAGRVTLGRSEYNRLKETADSAEKRQGVINEKIKEIEALREELGMVKDCLKQAIAAASPGSLRAGRDRVRGFGLGKRPDLKITFDLWEHMGTEYVDVTVKRDPEPAAPMMAAAVNSEPRDTTDASKIISDIQAALEKLRKAA